MKQKTLKGSFSLFGKGLHTGLNLTVTFNPAPENTGYKIQRIDLEGEPIIDGIAENVIDTQRGTVLAKGDARVSTVEHGLAALYALGIDNCMIQVNGPEFPILDGSAIQYVEKIREVGIEEQNAPKDWYIIRKKIEVKDEKTGSCITILPDDEFSITAMCSFDSKIINSQFATVNSSTSARQHRSASTCWQTCWVWSIAMLPSWATYNTSRWYGRTNVRYGAHRQAHQGSHHCHPSWTYHQ